MSLVAALIAILAAETLLRLVSPIYTTGIQSSYQYDPELGVTLRKNVRLSRLTDHLEEVRTNRFGVADFRESYEGYSALAFALGDSFTQGTGLPADESYPMQLDQMLNRDSAGMFSMKVAVVNLGLGSYGGEQSFRALKRFEKILGAPAYCLYLGSDNDYDDDLLFKNGSRHRQLVAGSPTWGVFVKPLAWIGNLQLVLRAKMALTQRRLSALRQADGVAAWSPTDSQTATRSAAELEWPVIQRVVSECRTAHAIPIVSWAPYQGMQSYDWLRAKAAATKIAFNDWHPRVEVIMNAVPSIPAVNPHSGGHYRAWVASIIADGYLREMRRNSIGGPF